MRSEPGSSRASRLQLVIPDSSLGLLLLGFQLAKSGLEFSTLVFLDCFEVLLPELVFQTFPFDKMYSTNLHSARRWDGIISNQAFFRALGDFDFTLAQHTGWMDCLVSDACMSDWRSEWGIVHKIGAAKMDVSHDYFITIDCPWV